MQLLLMLWPFEGRKNDANFEFCTPEK